MSKRIALIVILVMLVNMSVWANEEEDSLGPILGIVAGVLVVLIVFAVLLGIEADAPDNEIMLASKQNEISDQKTMAGSFLNVLQHVNFGYTPQDNKVFFGLNFRY